MNIITSKDNAIINKMFGKAEVSYALSDISKAIGPIIDLVFIALFIGTDGVTVVGYVSPLITFFELIGTAFSSGARSKVSVFIGQGKSEEASKGFSSSLIMSGGICIILAILVIIFRMPVASFLGARDPEIQKLTAEYILGYLVGFPFFTLTKTLTPFLQMEGQYSRVNVTSLLTTVIDVSADAFVIFVLGGGMLEIGLATSVGYIIPFFIGASYFAVKRKKSFFHMRFNNFDLKVGLEILRTGAPSGIVKASSSVGGTIINNLLTAMNVNYLVAAYGVFSQISSFVRSSWWAPADTLHALVGIFKGEEDRASLKKIQKIALTHALLFTSIIAVLIFALATPLSGVFMKSDDPEALKISVQCLRVACFSLIFHSIVYNFNSYLMPIGRIRFCCLYSFLIECGCMVPITFITLQLMGYQGAWYGKVISMAVVSLIAFVYICICGEGSTFSDKMLLLPESFGFSPEDELSAEYSTAEEIQELSRIAVEFALKHGAERNRALRLGLVVEDMGRILSEHGLADGKEHHINTRLVAKDEDLIIGMRDDCETFNMSEYDELLKDDNKDMSLAIILKIAKEFKYSTTYGVNNVIVRI